MISGWCASHDVETGAAGLTGRWLAAPFSEDVAGWHEAAPLHGLSTRAPGLWQGLVDAAVELQTEHSAPVEFLFEATDGKVRVVRARPARLQPRAHLVAVQSLAGQGVITTVEAMRAVHPAEVEACLVPTLDPTAHTVLGTGLGVSAGIGRGKVVFHAEEAARVSAEGELCILVVDDLRPEDIAVSLQLTGLISLRGGATSHAAVVAKGLGIPMIAGLRDARLDPAAGVLWINDTAVARHDRITMDGRGGLLLAGEVAVTTQELPVLDDLLEWADAAADVAVLANADSGDQVATAMRAGAAGVGLCRIEHVLTTGGHLPLLRRVSAATDPSERTALIGELTDVLTDRLREVVAAAGGKPVTIRLLDIAQHELLDPKDDRAGRPGDGPEVNPVMGARGVRDLLVDRDLGSAQVRAIIRAGSPTNPPNILVPMISFPEEFRRARKLIENAWSDETGGHGTRPAIGAMIEIPRAALGAAELATDADFLCIGSNDLTQFTLALSRDDGHAGFLEHYRQEGILGTDPFVDFDDAGVGRLIRLCVELARTARPDIPIAVCGEHTGDPGSLAALLELGLTYVSCSPHAVAVARFVAGRQAILATTPVAAPPTTGKLVRDHIPAIIRKAGLEPLTEKVAGDRYRGYLEAKLSEELGEFLESGKVEELADLVEVCFAAADQQGVDRDALLAIAADKRSRRGGFTEQVIWYGNQSAADRS